MPTTAAHIDSHYDALVTLIQDQFKGVHRRMDSFDAELKEIRSKNDGEVSDLSQIKAQLEYQGALGPKLNNLEERVIGIELNMARATGTFTVTSKIMLWGLGIVGMVTAGTTTGALIFLAKALATLAAKP